MAGGEVGGGGEVVGVAEIDTSGTGSSEIWPGRESARDGELIYGSWEAGWRPDTGVRRREAARVVRARSDELSARELRGKQREKGGQSDPHHHAILRRGSNTTRKRRSGGSEAAPSSRAPMAAARVSRD